MANLKLELNVSISTKLTEGTCFQEEAVQLLLDQIKADIETVYSIDENGKNCWFDNTVATVERVA